MGKKLLLATISTLILLSISLSFVSAEVGDIKATPKIGGGADLEFTIINRGETGGFNAYANCDSGNSLNNFQGSIQAGETKTINLSVGGECLKETKCTVYVESVSGVVEGNVSFMNNCNLCGTELEACKAGSNWCEGNQIKECDQYCRTTSVIKTCQTECTNYNSATICKEESNWFVRNNFPSGAVIYSIVFVLVIILIIFIVYKKTRK